MQKDEQNDYLNEIVISVIHLRSDHLDRAEGGRIIWKSTGITRQNIRFKQEGTMSRHKISTLPAP